MSTAQKWFAVVGISIMVTVFLLDKRSKEQDIEILAHGKKYVGLVDVHGKRVTCTIKWDDGSYRTVTASKPHGSIYDGERYYVYSWNKFPGRLVVDFTEPIIDSTFRKINGRVIKQRNRLVKFTYTVASVEYTRHQLIEEEVVAGRLYPVYVKKDFPKIAYVLPGKNRFP
ncbi:MAG TPA: hypothetical protein VGD65_00185 [Chryseosolibacter sp.]